MKTPTSAPSTLYIRKTGVEGSWKSCWVSSFPRLCAEVLWWLVLLLLSLQRSSLWELGKKQLVPCDSWTLQRESWRWCYRKSHGDCCAREAEVNSCRRRQAVFLNKTNRTAKYPDIQLVHRTSDQTRISVHSSTMENLIILA